MPPKAFLPILPEPIRSGVNHYLVVPGLEGDVFAGGVRRGTDEGVHVGFCDEFDGDGDIVFPCSKGFVVRGCYEAPVLVDEGDGVYGAEMVVVFL